MSVTWGEKMHCPYPHCTKPEDHDGQHDTNRTARMWESAKLTFAIVGATGYAGFLAAMHWFLCGVSMVLVGATCYGIYRVLDVE